MERLATFVVRNSLIISCCAFLCGVGIASVFSIHMYIWYVSIALSSVFLISSFSVYEKKKQTALQIGVLCICIFFAGSMRFVLHSQTLNNTSLEPYIGEKIKLIATIVESPQDKGSYTSYIVSPEDSREKILVRANVYPEFQYGDRVTFFGKLEVPKNFTTETGKEFDYRRYLKKDGIKYILPFANGTLISSGNGNVIESSLLRIKSVFLKNIQNIIVEPESSLLAGILLGVDSLGREIEEKFRVTGIVHIVVLSGYNITIVSESLIQFFSFIPKQFALSIGAFGIVLFSIMVGGTPSVLRASFMALLVLLARYTGRTYDVGRALLFAACAMVLWNPQILVFDISFQLSFLSTVALIWISPVFFEALHIVPEKFKLREITATTLSTQLFVLPLLLFSIGDFSIVGLPVNILVLGLIPPIMFFGFITGLLGFFSYWIALPFAFITYWMLAYVLQVADVFSRIPFASMHIEFFSVGMFWLLYGVYGILFWKFGTKKHIRIS